MGYKELFFIKAFCLFLIAISFVVKFIFWRKIKKDEPDVKPFWVYFLVWYTVYAMYDSNNSELKMFMKISNRTNFFIWIPLVIMALSFALQKLTLG